MQGHHSKHWLAGRANRRNLCHEIVANVLIFKVLLQARKCQYFKTAPERHRFYREPTVLLAAVHGVVLLLH